MKKYTLMVLCLGLLIFSSCQHNGDEKLFSLSLDNTKDSVTYLYAEEFARIVNEMSDTMKVTIYPGAVLGNDRESIESLQIGDIDFVVQNTAPQVAFIPQAAIFDLFMLYQDIETVRRAMDSSFFDAIASCYEEKNIKLLGFADQHFRELTTNRRITSIEDFEGLKIRTMASPYHIRFWREIGANPTPMNWGEVYIALGQKTIDAQENPYESIVASRVYEQQKYVIETHHVPHLVSLIMNNKKFQSLSSEERHIIEEAAMRAKKKSRNDADQRLEAKKKVIEDAGLGILIPDQRLLFELKMRAKRANDVLKKSLDPKLLKILEEEIHADHSCP